MKRGKNYFKKFNYVYVTINLINGKRYIGDHSTDNLDDGYMGSGDLICEAFKKYGKENFKKEILQEFKTKRESFAAQEKYIIEYNTLEPNGYNLHRKGGWDPLPFEESPEKIQKYFDSLKDVRCGKKDLIIIHIPIKNLYNR
jgi:hypothetical protein